MKTVSRLALALPLCAAIAAPASAQVYNLTVDGTPFLLTTVTAKAEDLTQAQLNLMPWIGSDATQATSFATASQSSSPVMPTNFNNAGSLGGAAGAFFAYSFASNGFSFAAVRDDNQNVVTAGPWNPGLERTFAILVPEINGSGFAYIAFILGALGLWLYSGPARGRQEETPAVA